MERIIFFTRNWKTLIAEPPLFCQHVLLYNKFPDTHIKEALQTN